MKARICSIVKQIWSLPFMYYCLYFLAFLKHNSLSLGRYEPSSPICCCAPQITIPYSIVALNWKQMAQEENDSIANRDSCSHLFMQTWLKPPLLFAALSCKILVQMGRGVRGPCSDNPLTLSCLHWRMKRLPN